MDLVVKHKSCACLDAPSTDPGARREFHASCPIGGNATMADEIPMGKPPLKMSVTSCLVALMAVAMAGLTRHRIRGANPASIAAGIDGFNDSGRQGAGERSVTGVRIWQRRFPGERCSMFPATSNRTIRFRSGQARSLNGIGVSSAITTALRTLPWKPA